MEENDVFFNGAREERTQQSALGVAQAYSVHHLVPAMRGARLSHSKPEPLAQPQPQLTSAPLPSQARTRRRSR